MRRRGFPFSEKLLRAGRATLLHQHSSRKPATQLPGLFSAILISRLRRLFSLILRIWRGDPPLGPLPAHPHPLKSGPDSLPRNSLFGKPSSKLTSAAISKVHKLLCLSKLLGLL